MRRNDELQRKILNILLLFRLIFYLVAGTLILVFNRVLMDTINSGDSTQIAHIVGAVLILYGLEGIAVDIHKHTLNSADTKFYYHEMLVCLGVLLMFYLEKDFDKICVLWGVWSLLREGLELSDCIHRRKKNIVANLSILESVVVIVLSLAFIIAPLKHVRVHIILLGIELILEVLFPLVEYIIKTIKTKKTKNIEEITN